MKQAFSGKFGKKQLIFFLIYAVVLIGGYDALEWSLRYEVLAQPFYTLWPIFTLTAVIVLVVACALLLAARVPLGLLLGLHLLAAGWWLTSAQLRVIDQEGHFFLLQWFMLVPLLLSCVPPLLGYGLLRLRYRALEKQRETAPAAEIITMETATAAMQESTQAGTTDAGQANAADTTQAANDATKDA